MGTITYSGSVAEFAPNAFGLVYGPGLLVTIVVIAAMRLAAVRNEVDEVAELNLDATALLAGGPERVAEMALAGMVMAGTIEARETVKLLVSKNPYQPRADEHPIDHVLLATIPMEGTLPGPVVRAAADVARPWEEALAGLVVPPRQQRLLILIPAMAALVLALIGVWWVSARTVAGRTTGLVPLMPMAATAVLAWVVFDRPRLTRAGRARLAAIRRSTDHLLSLAATGVTSLPAEDALRMVALYGREAMTGSLLPLRRVLDAYKTRGRVEGDTWDYRQGASTV